jgi:bifunctional DNA-binding transcriptional regulator/antitoxin component of YhaV-PrlF toxin-antitoxin module
MTVAVKNNNKLPLVVPTSVRRAAGFKSGQQVEFKAAGGVITILPKLPDAKDEYTRAERRRIDAKLAAAEAGPYHGPFSGDEAVDFIKKELKKRASAKKLKRP